MNVKIAFLLTAMGIIVCSLLSAQVTRIPVSPDDEKPQSKEDTQILMQAKLSNAQNVLEGLVTQDFAAIEAAAASLAKISLNPPPSLEEAGDDSGEELYEHFRLEFARLAGDLERHARKHELEATAYVHQNMTANCIACHDYIRDNP